MSDELKATMKPWEEREERREAQHAAELADVKRHRLEVEKAQERGNAIQEEWNRQHAEALAEQKLHGETLRAHLKLMEALNERQTKAMEDIADALHKD